MPTTPPPRPLPVLNDENYAFWTGGADQRLMICRCQQCQRYIHPPLPMCGSCLSRDVMPEAVSGRARVATYTVNHMQWQPGLNVPYTLAIVELEEQEGLYVTTEIVNLGEREIDVGMEMKVVFEQQEDIYLPLFEPR